MNTTTDLPCAACPSKMGGTPTTTISFPTEQDRRLFNAAVSIAHDRKLPLLDALVITYDVAAEVLPTIQELDCSDFSLHVIKGAVSPYAAMIDVRRRYYSVDAVKLEARHVWLRTTVANWSGEYSCVIANGNPDGTGGSYRATVVAMPEDANTYDVSAAPAPIVCRVTADWLAAWEQFTARARGTLC
jgi:hypothetical protein